MEHYQQNLYQLLAGQSPVQSTAPPPVPKPKALDQQTGSLLTTSSNTEFAVMLLQVLVGKVWVIECANKSQAIVIVNCGVFKIVQNQRVTLIIPLETIIGVARTSNQTTPDGSNVFGFKLCYIDDMPRYTATFGVRKKTSRDLWMNAFAKELVSAYKGTGEYISLHQCYLMSARTWTLTWVLVTENRRLVFYDATGVAADVDLRKMRSLEWDTDHLVLSHPNQILKIRILDQMYDWRQSVLNMASSLVDKSLENQKLNSQNVPVILAKCLNHIFVHGLTSEGIYRKSGVISKVTKLLADFAKNPFDVSIHPDDYTEHDVASALRKFLRELPEPVVGTLGARLNEIADIRNDVTRIEKLKKLIDQLSEIRFNTLREIVRHLYVIQTQQSVNMMSTQNLAIVWGKCLLGDTESHNQDEIVIGDLIAHKKFLFDLRDDDLVIDMEYFEAMEKTRARESRFHSVINEAHEKLNSNAF